MADEHIQFRMGVDHANVAKGLNSVQRDVQKFVGKTRKDFEQVGKSFGEQFKQANRSLSQSVGLGIASLARKAIEDVWDLMTKKAADFLFTNQRAAAAGAELEKGRQAWREARKEQVAAWEKEEQVTKDNAKRDELRTSMARERHRIEEETALKPGDEKAFTEMKIRHLKEDISLGRSGMRVGRFTTREQKSLDDIHNEKQMTAIARAEQALKLEEAKLPAAVKAAPVFTRDMRDAGTLSRVQSLREQMVGRFGDPTKGGYRDPMQQKKDELQAQVNASMSQIITAKGIKIDIEGSQ